MKQEDYTLEYCPFCEREVAIRSNGVTACPSCGKPLAPCTICNDCSLPNSCLYGCTGSADDEFLTITNPPMTVEEIAFAEVNCYGR